MFNSVRDVVHVPPYVVLLLHTLLASSPAFSVELISNGGFEQGADGWSLSGAFHADCCFPNPHSGVRYAYVSLADGSPGNNLIGIMTQDFFIPATVSSAELTFWVSVSSQETSTTQPFDVLSVSILDTFDNPLALVDTYSNLNATVSPVYQFKSFSLTEYSGSSVRLRFLATTDSSLPTIFRVDDVSVQVEIQQFSLSVIKSGTGTGTVTSLPSGIQCGTTCLASFESGTIVTLSASPAPGSMVTGFGGDCDSFGRVTLTGTKSCTVQFDLLPQSFNLAIEKQGSATGTVTSNPSGIDCGSVCTSTFQEGELVQLIATPDSGAVFAGWGGDGDCIDGVVSMLTNRHCIASFEPEPVVFHTLTVTKQGTGEGIVTSDPPGVNCGLDCSEDYLEGAAVGLSVFPAAGSRFSGWLFEPDCEDFLVSMDASRLCIAVFDLIEDGIFFDGFESGNTSAWSDKVGEASTPD